MPELPEVETVRRGLIPVMEGHRIARAEIRHEGLRRPFPPRLGERLAGRRVLALGRRAKYILADLDAGETLLIHLGMSGRLIIDAAGPPGRHDHVVIHMENGARLAFNDARRFGTIDLIETHMLARHPLLEKLGPEPLGNAFGGEALAAALAGRNTTIKAALMDQRTVAGLGNIYVCEALHRAGIHPARQAGKISRPRIGRLAQEIRAVLEDAIEAGGSSLRDYRRADGELGYFQHAFRVYGRESEPCARPGCKGTIARISQAGRSTFYCPRCQR